MKSSIDAKIQHIKDCVIRINEMEGPLQEYSEIWQGCANVLGYLADLSPYHLKNVRLHTEIFTGEFFNFILFNAQNQNGHDYAEGLGYIFAAESLPEKYWISEPPILGWTNGKNIFGCEYNGRVINPEIARYQLYFENFISTGMLDQIENSKQRSVILEIGAGYGAIGYHLLKQTNRKVCYLVLDLPLMLLYTGCYIATHIPDAKILTYDPANPDHKNLDDAIIDYDVVLIPNHQLSVLNKLSRIDYAINTISMAEMTSKQVQDYIDFISPRLVNYFYFQNYAWSYPKPLEEFVGDSFYSTPDLNFYSNYLEESGTAAKGNYLKTYYFSTNKKVHETLKNCKIKLRMPDGQPAQISLDGKNTAIRTMARKYQSMKRKLLLKFRKV